jgi:hypothetical protein
MKIDWNKIKQKYPKSYFKFLNYGDGKIEEFEIHNNSFSKYGLPLCYCDLEKFFDDNGIKIFILPYFASISNEELQRYQILIIDKKYARNFDCYNLRIEAKAPAIYKAFEILEATL